MSLPSQRGEIATFELKPENRWAADVEANADDFYGRRIITFAADWAWLMEQRLAEGGCTVAEIADATSHLADYDGITGFMYGGGVAELTWNWVHGDELRRWHNGEYGQPDAEGVIDPAILTIGTQE